MPMGVDGKRKRRRKRKNKKRRVGRTRRERRRVTKKVRKVRKVKKVKRGICHQSATKGKKKSQSGRKVTTQRTANRDNFKRTTHCPRHSLTTSTSSSSLFTHTLFKLHLRFSLSSCIPCPSFSIRLPSLMSTPHCCHKSISQVQVQVNKQKRDPRFYHLEQEPGKKNIVSSSSHETRSRTKRRGRNKQKELVFLFSPWSLN